MIQIQRSAEINSSLAAWIVLHQQQFCSIETSATFSSKGYVGSSDASASPENKLMRADSSVTERLADIVGNFRGRLYCI